MPVTINGNGAISGLGDIDGHDLETATLVVSGDTTIAPQAVGRATLFVDDSANSVGINTTTPASGVFLQVADGTDPIVSLNNTGNGEVRLGCTANTGYLRTESNHALALQTNATNAIYIDTNQRVGLGTSTPQSALHILNSSAQIRLENGGTFNAYGLLTAGSTGNLFFTADPNNVGGNTRISFELDGAEVARFAYNATNPVVLNVGNTTPDFPKVINAQGVSGSILMLSSMETQTGAADVNAGIEFRCDDGNGNNVTNEIRGAKENSNIGDNASYISFHTRPSGGAMTEAARFNSVGNLAFPHNQGIDFSASEGSGAVTSVLNDYEVGTWTPILYVNNVEQTLNFQYYCNYTKIGNIVSVAFWFGFGAYGRDAYPYTDTTSIEFGGLPYGVYNTYQGGYPQDVGIARTQAGTSATFSISSNDRNTRFNFWDTAGNFGAWSGQGKLHCDEVSTSPSPVIAGSYTYRAA